MNINHHNYEEYFILYMDNELDSDERRMVEAFVQQHPGLREELDLLLQYKLVPDTNIVFTDKEELMIPIAIGMNDNSAVTLSNYDEWLVLYMDNELTAVQKTTVEQFMTANPSVKEELALLQRTQLQPEEIIFADKASLFRKEEKVKLSPVRWWRLAAAAVLLLGVGITTAVLINKKSSGGEEIVKGTTPEKKITPENPVVTPKESNSPVNENIVADNNTQVLTPVLKQSNNNNAIARKKNNALKNQLPVTIPTQIIKEDPVVVSNKPTNDLPQPLYNPNINRNDATNKAVAIDNTPIEIKQQNPLTNPVVTTKDPSSSDIVYASNNNTDATELEQADGKKNKNRGFFRKIARTFEKRTDIDPTDNNRLLVAGLAIKLK